MPECKRMMLTQKSSLTAEPERRRSPLRRFVTVGAGALLLGNSLLGVVSPTVVRAAGKQLSLSPSLITNGGFEKAADGWGWMTAGSAVAAGAVDTVEKHAGIQSFRLSANFDQTPNVYGRLFRTVYGLRPFTTYRIHAWAKGKAVGVAWIGGGPGWYHRKPFPARDFSWQEITTDYSTGAEAGDFELMVLVESHTGALWVDDIEMTEVSADAPRRDAAEQEARTSVGAERAHLAALRAQVAARPALRGDRYITLGLAVAERYLTRLNLSPEKRTQGGAWDHLQTEEVKSVLDETEKRIGATVTVPNTDVPPLGRGRAVLRDGVFRSNVGRGKVPYYFGGYGHFGAVASDLPVFPSLGASLIQQERGPSSSLGPISDTLLGGGRSMVDTLQSAGRSGMKIDLLLSPHYFPDWAAKQAPDVLNGNPGFLGFNIDHPVAQSVTQRHLRNLLTVIGREPALLSLCLSNEPIYSSSGRDKYSFPLWTAYLKRVHGTVESVNALYQTQYKRLEDVPVPPLGMPKETAARRVYYDWVRFNQAHFADWHRSMSDLCHRYAPGVPTHAKIMVFNTFEQGRVDWGVDPEMFCGATDIAGCDAYAFFRGDLLARFQRGDMLTPQIAATLPEDYAYGWQGDELFYDLLHSFSNQTVFNSENHVIPDGSPARHIPPEHTRAAFWQGGLHHQGATTTWVWEDSQDNGLAGSIYFRPANAYAEGCALLDLNRLSREVTAINGQTPHVAILYSPPSIFWEADYGGQVFRLYTALRFQGENVTFVSEKQLQSGGYPPVTRIILPHATHAADATAAALARFAHKAENKVVFVGTDNLAFDEYNHGRTLPAALAASVMLDGKPADAAGRTAFLRALRTALAEPGGKNAPPSLKYVGVDQFAWGIEYRAVADGKSLLVPLINFLPETQIVHLDLPGRTVATDLLSGATVDLTQIRLRSMEPLLLRIEK